MNKKYKIGMAFAILSVLIVLIFGNKPGFDSIILLIYQFLSLPAFFVAYYIGGIFQLGPDNLFVVILITSIYWFVIGWLIAWLILPKNKESLN